MPPRWFPRETRTAPQVIRLRMAPQNREGLPVMIEIACGIGGGLRPLAQHVEGMPEALRLEGGGMLQALFYRTAHDELAAHQMHGRAHRAADHRFAEPRHHVLENAEIGRAHV